MKRMSSSHVVDSCVVVVLVSEDSVPEFSDHKHEYCSCRVLVDVDVLVLAVLVVEVEVDIRTTVDFVSMNRNKTANVYGYYFNSTG